MKRIKSLLIIALLAITGVTSMAQNITMGRRHGGDDVRPEKAQIHPVEPGQEIKLFIPPHIADRKGLSTRWEGNRNVRIVFSNRKDCTIRGIQSCLASQVLCYCKYEDGKHEDGSPRMAEEVLTYYVEVLRIDPEQVKLNQLNVVGWGLSKRIDVMLYPENAECGFDFWVDDPNIATVKQDGYVTGQAVGETTIHVETSTGLTASATIRVEVPECTSVKFEDTDDLAKIGDVYTFTPTHKPEHAEVQYRWVSSDSSIIEIDENTGEARAVGKGKATIYLYSDNGCKYDRKFKIK